MNILQIAGHLGRDPETRFTASGQKVTTFTVAVNHRRGGKEEITVWVRVTVWGDRFDKLMPYLKKGSAVIVIGEMNPPTIYTDKEGRPQVSVEMTAEMIKFSPFGRSDRAGDEGQNAGHSHQNTAYAPQQNSTHSSYQDTGYSNTTSTYGRGSSSGYGQQTMQSAPDDDALPF